MCRIEAILLYPHLLLYSTVVTIARVSLDKVNNCSKIDDMEASIILKNWRKANQLTQEDVAVLFGVSQKAVSKWERDKSNPDPWRLYQVYLHGSYDVAVIAKRMLDTLGPKYKLP